MDEIEEPAALGFDEITQDDARPTPAGTRLDDLGSDGVDAREGRADPALVRAEMGRVLALGALVPSAGPDGVRYAWSE